jgi:uncharacterized protein YoxC
MPIEDVELLRAIILAIAAYFSARYLKKISEDIGKATDSIEKLNSKVAVVIERTETHSFEIELLRAKQDKLVEDVAVITTLVKVKSND